MFGIQIASIEFQVLRQKREVLWSSHCKAIIPHNTTPLQVHSIRVLGLKTTFGCPLSHSKSIKSRKNKTSYDSRHGWGKDQWCHLKQSELTVHVDNQIICKNTMNQNESNESELGHEKIDIIILIHLGIQSCEYTHVYIYTVHCNSSNPLTTKFSPKKINAVSTSNQFFGLKWH